MPSFIVLTDYTHVGNSFIRPFVWQQKDQKCLCFHQGDCIASPFCTVACIDRLSLTCDAFGAQRSHLHSKMTIAVMKTISDLYRYRSLKRPYKSGVTKIIGSVDRVTNHCLSTAF
jgi:hypothetical protein